MAKYVILVDDISDELLKKLADAIAGSGAGWWHWLPRVWLIADSQARGVKFWNNVCRGVAPEATVLVFQASDSPGYNGYLPNPWHGWLNKHWR